MSPFLDVRSSPPSPGASPVDAARGERQGPAPDPFLGRTLAGRYRIEAVIGEGATGRVYRATELPAERVVAVKVLRADAALDPTAVPRFRRESQAAGRVDHPNVVAVFEHGREGDGTEFIAMEYVPGESLRDLLAREGPLPAGDCVGIMAQVLRALAGAHAAGVIHRDVKPANILVADPAVGGRRVVKLADFGLAAVLDRGASLKLTAAGAVAGSPAYLSPEQAAAREVDARSDVYQCGAVLFEMVTGRPPFVGGSALAVIMQHLHAAPPSPRALNLLCPVALERVILVALAKEPERRFGSALAMRDALCTLAPAGPGTLPTWARSERPTSPHSARPTAPGPRAPTGRAGLAGDSARFGAAVLVVAALGCALGLALTLRVGHAAVGPMPVTLVRPTSPGRAVGAVWPSALAPTRSFERAPQPGGTSAPAPD